MCGNVWVCSSCMRWIHAFIHACMHVWCVSSVCVRMLMCACECERASKRACMRACVHVCKFACTGACVHALVCAWHTALTCAGAACAVHAWRLCIRLSVHPSVHPFVVRPPVDRSVDVVLGLAGPDPAAVPESQGPDGLKDLRSHAHPAPLQAHRWAA